MSLKQKISDDLKQAIKSGDVIKRDTIRMLGSMIKNVEIEKKKKNEGLDDAEVQEIIARGIKQRRDASAQYKAGGRPELAQKEEKEIEILSTYIPQQLSEAEIQVEVKEIISGMGATQKSEIGRVMGAAMARLKGKADGNLVKKIAEAELK